ncbi:MAG: oxidoreductase, partial [Chloroflexi bacterium]|nr:oxidoreductase [Chloroflexota bacterium]
KLVGENAVTSYLHERAGVGDTLYIAGGSGDFFFEKGMGDSLVLIGGGIGITPLMSIVRYVDEACPQTRLTLFYSAQTPSELIFHKELGEIAARNPKVRCVFTVTRDSGKHWDGYTGRIGAELLGKERAYLNALFYVCGPTPMIQDMVAMLKSLRVPSSRVRYEQWW